MLQSKYRTILASLLAMSLATATVAHAQDEEAPQGWTGKGELGFVNTSGNTDTTTLNLGLEFIREADKWRHRVGFSALRAEDSGVDTADRLVGEWQSDYKFSEVAWALGSLRHEADDFSGFEFQQSLVFGAGRQLIDNDTHNLKIEGGPGYRRLKDATTGETSSDGILRGVLDYAWTVSETTTFTNRFLAEAGSDNTFLENDAALSVAINDRFALKFGVNLRHNTDAPAGTDDTDALTTANLVYNFK